MLKSGLKFVRYLRHDRELNGVVDTALIANTVALYLIQAANYFLPIITIPYLVRVLGPANYGAVAFAQSLISYLMVLVDYGFDLSATRKISVHRNNSDIVNYISIHTWTAKSVLCLGSFLILAIIIFLVPQVKEVSYLTIILYGLVIGNVLFPLWLFQGMERMVAIAIINLATRLLVVVGTFVLVRKPEDYVVYAGLLSAGGIVGGCVGVVVAAHVFRLRVFCPSFGALWRALRDGWPLFVATAAGNIYVIGNSFILGLFSSYAAVGYYNAAEKMVRFVVGLLNPLVRAAYPRSAKIASDPGPVAAVWVLVLLVVMGSAGLILSVVLLLCAPWIVGLVLGGDYSRSVVVMRILSPLPFLISISYVLGAQVIVPLGLDRVFTVILVAGALLDVGLSIIAAPLWSETGAALALVATEGFVAFAMVGYLHQRGLVRRWSSGGRTAEEPWV